MIKHKKQGAAASFKQMHLSGQLKSLINGLQITVKLTKAAIETIITSSSL